MESQYEAAEKLILKWDSTTASEEARIRMIFHGNRQEADKYLLAVDEIQRSMESSSDPNKINSFAIQIAMARLQDEFRSILINQTNPIEIESLINSTRSSSVIVSTVKFKTSGESDSLIDSISSIRWSSVTESSAEFRTARESIDEGYLEDEVSFSINEELGEWSSISYQSTNSISEIQPSEAIYFLSSIAERMITAGYLRECIQIYASVRKSAIDASFGRLGIEKLSIGDVQGLQWDLFEAKIIRWIGAAKVCVRILFAREKRLCEQIFEGEGLGSTTLANDACFIETVKGPAIQLFNFAEAIRISRPPPEKLFHVLDLYETLSELVPDVEVVFGSNSLESVRVQASEMLSMVAKAAKGMLSDFENLLLNEPSKSPLPGGLIDSLARYVMNYISLISDYKQTMMELIVSNPSTIDDPDIDFPKLENPSPLAVHLIWIIEILQFKLEGKSKYYKDASLSHISLMNNVHYIAQKVQGSPELLEIIGDDYLRKLTRKFQQAGMNYQRFTWGRILHCLIKVAAGDSFSSGVSKTVLRERLKTFNSMFEEVHRVQATWSVPNIQLREDLRISISEKLIPAYRSFLGRFSGYLKSKKHPERYIKYSVEDLEIAIFDFFEGHTVPLHTKKRSQ